MRSTSWGSFGSPRPDWVRRLSTRAALGSWPSISGPPDWQTGSSGVRNRVTWGSSGTTPLDRRMWHPGDRVSPYREIRTERGQKLQGLRAGFASRVIASGTDVVLVLCAYVLGVVIVSIAWDLFFSTTI